MSCRFKHVRAAWIVISMVTSRRADFVYLEHGKEIVEDTKGMRTQVYVMKRKLMKALYGITILET